MTPKEVAQWMLDELTRVKYLDQEVVVYAIKDKFGSEFTYDNENGNLAIDKGVLREFSKLTVNTVVWERGARLWRFRENYDPPGERQVD